MAGKRPKSRKCARVSARSSKSTARTPAHGLSNSNRQSSNLPPEVASSSSSIAVLSTRCGTQRGKKRRALCEGDEPLERGEKRSRRGSAGTDVVFEERKKSIRNEEVASNSLDEPTNIIITDDKEKSTSETNTTSFEGNSTTTTTDNSTKTARETDKMPPNSSSTTSGRVTRAAAAARRRETIAAVAERRRRSTRSKRISSTSPRALSTSSSTTAAIAMEADELEHFARLSTSSSSCASDTDGSSVNSEDVALSLHYEEHQEELMIVGNEPNQQEDEEKQKQQDDEEQYQDENVYRGQREPVMHPHEAREGSSRQVLAPILQERELSNTEDDDDVFSDFSDDPVYPNGGRADYDDEQMLRRMDEDYSDGETEYRVHEDRGRGRAEAFDVYASDEENDDEDDEGSGTSDLENEEFDRYERVLNDVTKLNAMPPPQLTEGSCAALGSPKKVWNLMCRKDVVGRERCDYMASKEGGRPGLSQKSRIVLIDWMMEVCSEEYQHREMFHLAVDYVDRYMARDRSVSIQNFQLIGTAAMFLAAKYEEIYPPKVDDFASYTDGACSEEHIRQTELIMVKTLGWSLATMTSIHWLGVFLRLLGTREMVNEQQQANILPQTPQKAGSFGAMQQEAAAAGTSRDASRPSWSQNSVADSELSTTTTTSPWADRRSTASASSQQQQPQHYAERPCTIAEFLREDYCFMAMILDVLLLDSRSLLFSYRELAAAVVFAVYEPHSLVQQVTGYAYADLTEVTEWIEPFVEVCQRWRAAGDPMRRLPGVAAGELHTIQTQPYGRQLEEIMDEVEAARKKQELKRYRASVCRGAPLKVSQSSSTCSVEM